MDDSESSVKQLLNKALRGDTHSVISLTRSLVSQGVLFPFTCFKLGVDILSQKGQSLGDEKWGLLEKVLIAAIKLDIEPWIGYSLKALRSKFPGSGRVERLAALYRESKEDWVEAEAIYKQMLNKSPESVYPRKRLIACLKAQGRVKDAIGAITDQLEIFSADPELWHELSMLYMTQGAYSRAASAFDEVLLNDPKSFYNLLVYAEIEFSAGNIVLARKYYCQALEYRPREPRALWGLLCCLQEATISPGKRADTKELKLLGQLKAETKRRLEEIYRPINTPSAKVCLGMLERIE
jgi:tetratricopeptide (TPR) repeat protein